MGVWCPHCEMSEYGDIAVHEEDCPTTRYTEKPFQLFEWWAIGANEVLIDAGT